MKPFHHITENEIYINTNIKRGSLIQAHIADIHFGVINPKVQYDILKDQIINVLYNLPILDIIAIDGDLFDRKYMGDTDAISYATRFISDLVSIAKIKSSTLIIIAGTKSHDSGQLKLFYHYLTNSDVDVRIVETIQFEIIKGARILCIPELYRVSESIYEKYLFNSGYYDMCFMHGTIKGAVYGDNVGEGRLFQISDFCKCLGPIISGHIHTGGCFNSYFYYTSSPLRWKFGEEQPKGFLIILYDLDTRYHYTHLQEVKSFIYKTINLSDLVYHSPEDIINYINNIKEKEGIDYIRVQFDIELEKSKADIINNYYKDNNTVKIKIDKNTKNITRDTLTKSEAEIYDKFSYLFSNNISPYDKLSRFIIDKEPDAVYVTGQCILDILNDKF